MRKRWIWILLTVIVMVTIFVFSAQDSRKSVKTSDTVAKVLRVKKTQKNLRVSNQPLVFGLTLRKLAHIFLYFCLGFCMTQTLDGWKFRIPGGAVFSYLYAVSDELHQHWTGREGKFGDTMIDLIGIAIGVAAAILFTRVLTMIRERRKTRAETKADA